MTDLWTHAYIIIGITITLIDITCINLAHPQLEEVSQLIL
jgi:hypothetical protein